MILTISALSVELTHARPMDEGGARVELIRIGARDHSGARQGHVGLRVITDSLDQLYLFRERAQQDALWRRLLIERVELIGEVVPFERALEGWRAQDRAVTAHLLMLSPVDVKLIYRSLETRVYGRGLPLRYGLFTSRDATLVRSLLDEVTEGAISKALVARRRGAMSWRDELRSSYARAPLAALSLELALGGGVDQARSLWELSATPRYLIRLLHEVRYRGRPLLGLERQLHISSNLSRAEGLWSAVHWYISASMMCWFALAWRVSQARPLSRFTSSTIMKRRRASQTLIINLSVCSLGLLSMCAWWLSLQSDWLEARQSWLLWLTSPLDLILYVRGEVRSEDQCSWRIKYLIIRGSTSALIVFVFALSLGALPAVAQLSIAIALWMSAFMGLKSLRAYASHINHNQLMTDSQSVTVTSQAEELSWL